MISCGHESKLPLCVDVEIVITAQPQLWCADRWQLKLFRQLWVLRVKRSINLGWKGQFEGTFPTIRYLGFSLLSHFKCIYRLKKIISQHKTEADVWPPPFSATFFVSVGAYSFCRVKTVYRTLSCGDFLVFEMKDYRRPHYDGTRQSLQPCWQLCDAVNRTSGALSRAARWCSG